MQRTNRRQAVCGSVDLECRELSLHLAPLKYDLVLLAVKQRGGGRRLAGSGRRVQDPGKKDKRRDPAGGNMLRIA
jgi:hypothetical protein